MDGSKASARSQASGKPRHQCVPACGRIIHGNAAWASHAKACRHYAAVLGGYLTAAEEKYLREQAYASVGTGDWPKVREFMHRARMDVARERGLLD